MTIAQNWVQTTSQGIDLDLVKESHKRLTAMIIDDEPETVRMMKFILMEAGMDVVGANSGLDAIDICPHTQPDVILLDLMMPVLDGFAVLAKIKEDDALRLIPVIIVSAANDSKSVVKGIKQGADDYITKPIDAEHLKKKVKEFLG